MSYFWDKLYGPRKKFLHITDVTSAKSHAKNKLTCRINLDSLIQPLIHIQLTLEEHGWNHADPCMHFFQ